MDANHDFSRNVLRGNTDGVRVRSYVTNSTLPTDEPWANATRNRIANNSHGVHLQGVVAGSTTYSVWADVHDNNTIGSFGGVLGNAYGVWIDAGTVDLTKFRTWWNDVRSNGQGVHVAGPDPGPGNYFAAYCNWWSHDTGPFDPSGPAPAGLPDWNPTGQGQPVSDYFHYRDEVPPPPPQTQRWWLDAPADQETECTPAP